MTGNGLYHLLSGDDWGMVDDIVYPHDCACLRAWSRCLVRFPHGAVGSGNALDFSKELSLAAARRFPMDFLGEKLRGFKMVGTIGNMELL